MSYIKNNWANGDKVTAEKLNNIENGIEELDNKTKIVEKGFKFKEFQIGDRFPSGYELTIDNSNGVVPSKTYYFYAYNSNGEYLEAFDLLVSLIKDSPIQFQWGFEATGDNFITNAVIFGADPEDIATFIPEIAYYELVDSSSVSGSGLLGGYGETELTLQDVYDNTKVVGKTIKRVGNPFEVGKIFEAGDTIGLNNVSDVKLESDNFYFEPYETTNQTDGLMINAKYLGNGKFSLYIMNDYEDLYEGEEDTIELDLGVYGVGVPFDYMGWKLVRLENNPGTYSLIGDYEDVEVETQLTAQEVYDKLNTGIGYKTAKAVVKDIENETYEITLPEIVDAFNGNLLIKDSNNIIIQVVFDVANGYFKIHKENFTDNSIELQGFLFGNDGLGSENYIILFVNGLLSDFKLRGGEEVEIMYFVSPFAMRAEV